MKKYLSILLILMLSVTLFSCKKKADNDDPYIESVAGESKENNDVNDTTESQKQDDSMLDKEENASAQNQQQVTGTVSPDTPQQLTDEELTDTVIEPETEIKPEQYPPQESEPEPDDSYYEEPIEYKSPTIYAQNSRIFGWVISTDRYALPSTIERDGITYFYHGEGCFPKYTIYENVDLSKLQTTGEKVTYIDYVPGPMDDVAEYTIKGEICKLPDEMQNDPYVAMLAVRKEDGETVLFFNSEINDRNYLIEDNTFYRMFLRYNRLCGSECLSAQNVDAILLSYSQSSSSDIETQVTVSGEKAQKFYDKISKFELSDSNTTPDKSSPLIYISFRFKDGTNTVPVAYRINTKSIDGCKPLPEFNDYILSFFEK